MRLFSYPWTVACELLFIILGTSLCGRRLFVLSHPVFRAEDMIIYVFATKKRGRDSSISLSFAKDDIRRSKVDARKTRPGHPLGPFSLEANKVGAGPEPYSENRRDQVVQDTWAVPIDLPASVPGCPKRVTETSPAFRSDTESGAFPTPDGNFQICEVCGIGSAEETTSRADLASRSAGWGPGVVGWHLMLGRRGDRWPLNGMAWRPSRGYIQVSPTMFQKSEAVPEDPDISAMRFPQIFKTPSPDPTGIKTPSKVT